jgi:hypothetical protein
MTEYVAAFAPASLPDIQYTRIDADQAAVISRAMELPENKADFEVSFLPVETLEQRQVAAEEWAGYKQAKGQIEARNRGALFVASSRDESPEALLELLEDRDDEPQIPYAPFVTFALLKVVKRRPDVHVYNLLREYYDDPKYHPTQS